MGALDIGITIRNLAIGVALILASVCLFYAGEISGYELGYKEAIEASSIDKTEYNFSMGIPTVYEYIYGKYSMIAFWLFVYVFGKIIRNLFYSSLVGILSSASAIYMFWQLTQYKAAMFEENFSYNKWMSKTLQFDWEGLVIVSIILLAEIITFLIVIYFKGKSVLMEEAN